MARLSQEQLADRSRYTFETQEVELPELDGEVEVKAMNVAERDEFMALLEEAKDKKGKAAIKVAAKVFSLAVSDPVVTPAEAEEFLGDLPSTALDRVLEQFADLFGSDSEEESAETRSDFRPKED